MNSEVKDVFVDELQTSIEHAITKAKGEQHAVIESGTQLRTGEKQRLETFLAKVLKRKVNTTYAVKPTLLAGFRVTVGDWKLDGTLLYQLEKMRDTIGGRSA